MNKTIGMNISSDSISIIYLIYSPWYKRKSFIIGIISALILIILAIIFGTVFNNNNQRKIFNITSKLINIFYKHFFHDNIEKRFVLIFKIIRVCFIVNDILINILDMDTTTFSSQLSSKFCSVFMYFIV